MRKIQIVIEDGVVMAARTDWKTREMLSERGIDIEVVNFDSDDGDRARLQEKYNEPLVETDCFLIYCNEEDDD